MTRLALLLSGALSALGCNLLLTDYETAAGGAANTGGENSGAANSGGGNPGGGNVGGSNLGPPAEGLQLDDTLPADQLAVFRQGFFRLETDAESNWQWARWFYLPDDPGLRKPMGAEDHTDGSTYYRTRCLWTAGTGSDYGGDPEYNFRSCLLSTLGADAFEPYDPRQPPTTTDSALPVWFTLQSTAESVRDTNTSFTTRVFASGHVWVSSSVVVTSDETYVTSDVELVYGFIALSNQHYEYPVGKLFPPKGGGHALLSIDGSPELGALWTPNKIADDPTGFYRLSNDSLELNVPRPFRSAFVLGSEEQLTGEAEERSEDVQNAALTVEGGEISPLSTQGFDRDTGTYLVNATTGAVSLDLGTTHTRFQPAFEVRDWQPSTFAIRLNGELLATETANGPNALATISNGTVAFQYLGVIPAGASDAERKLVITAD